MNDIDTSDIPVGTSIEIAGMLIDSEGHQWAVPAEGVEDYGDLGETNPFGKLNLDPNFHYQIERVGDLSAKMTQGMQPCTRREVGLPGLDGLERDFGKPEGTYVRLHDGVLCKIPKFLAVKRQAKKDALARSVREATEPTPEMLERARARSGSKRMKSASDINRGLGVGQTPVEMSVKTHKSARLEE